MGVVLPESRIMMASYGRHVVIAVIIALIAVGIRLYGSHVPYEEGVAYATTLHYVLDDGDEAVGMDRISLQSNQVTFSSIESLGGADRHRQLLGDVLSANRWGMAWRVTDVQDSNPAQDARLMEGGKALYVGRQALMKSNNTLRLVFVDSGSDNVICYYVATINRFRCLSRKS